MPLPTESPDSTSTIVASESGWEVVRIAIDPETGNPQGIRVSLLVAWRISEDASKNPIPIALDGSPASLEPYGIRQRGDDLVRLGHNWTESLDLSEFLSSAWRLWNSRLQEHHGVSLSEAIRDNGE